MVEYKDEPGLSARNWAPLLLIILLTGIAGTIELSTNNRVEVTHEKE